MNALVSDFLPVATFYQYSITLLANYVSLINVFYGSNA